MFGGRRPQPGRLWLFATRQIEQWPRRQTWPGQAHTAAELAFLAIPNAIQPCSTPSEISCQQRRLLAEKARILRPNTMQHQRRRFRSLHGCRTVVRCSAQQTLSCGVLRILAGSPCGIRCSHLFVQPPCLYHGSGFAGQVRISVCSWHSRSGMHLTGQRAWVTRRTHAAVHQAAETARWWGMGMERNPNLHCIALLKTAPNSGEPGGLRLPAIDLGLLPVPARWRALQFECSSTVCGCSCSLAPGPWRNIIV